MPELPPYGIKTIPSQIAIHTGGDFPKISQGEASSKDSLKSA